MDELIVFQIQVAIQNLSIGRWTELATIWRLQNGEVREHLCSEFYPMHTQMVTTNFHYTISSLKDMCISLGYKQIKLSFRESEVHIKIVEEAKFNK